VAEAPRLNEGIAHLLSQEEQRQWQRQREREAREESSQAHRVEQLRQRGRKEILGKDREKDKR